MLESGSSGSVRGASSNGRPYREPRSIWRVPRAIGERPVFAHTGRLESVESRCGAVTLG
jgi:hypothetical protein